MGCRARSRSTRAKIHPPPSMSRAGAVHSSQVDGFHGGSARTALRAGTGDAVSFARHFIGNPDLVRRLHEDLPLAGFDRHTLYTPGPRGYLDYPPLA